MLNTQNVRLKPPGAGWYVVLSFALLIGGCNKTPEQSAVATQPQVEASKSTGSARPAATDSAGAVAQDEQAKQPQTAADDKNAAATGPDWKNMREDGSFPETKAKVVTQAELEEMSRQTVKALEEAAKKAKAAGY